MWRLKIAATQGKPHLRGFNSGAIRKGLGKIPTALICNRGIKINLCKKY
jgi:hypothetical protein